MWENDPSIVTWLVMGLFTIDKSTINEYNFTIMNSSSNQSFRNKILRRSLVDSWISMPWSFGGDYSWSLSFLVSRVVKIFESLAPYLGEEHCSKSYLEKILELERPMAYQLFITADYCTKIHWMKM